MASIQLLQPVLVPAVLPDRLYILAQRDYLFDNVYMYPSCTESILLNPDHGNKPGV